MKHARWLLLALLSAGCNPSVDRGQDPAPGLDSYMLVVSSVFWDEAAVDPGVTFEELEVALQLLEAEALGVHRLVGAAMTGK